MFWGARAATSQAMTRALATLLAFLVISGTALASSTGHLVGQVNGKTKQPGGLIAPVFDTTTGRFYNASGTFRCTGKGAPAGSFAFYLTSPLPPSQQPAFQFNRRFTFKLSQRWYKTGQNPYKPLHYQPGKLTVTITGTIKKLSDPHGAYSGRVSGTGSVTFSANGCSSGKQSWSGTGQYARF